MKKIKRIIIALLLCICLLGGSAYILPQTAVTVEAATTSIIRKPSIKSYAQTGKKTAKVTWSKSSGAKGYQFQYRVYGGSWRSKNVSANKITLSKLSIGKTYCFRVRAYKKVSGKTKYSLWSVPKKLKVNEFVYLTSLYKPYSSSYYDGYTNGEYFEMGGKKQKNGFVLGLDYWAVDKKANFNIEGKFKKISFNVGRVDVAEDSTDSIVKVYSDGTLIKTVEVPGDDLPKKVTLPLVYTERLTFKAEGFTLIGFSNVKLFFR